MDKNIISMTELQKLSLKKLRKMKLPLYVLDRKSKGGGFMISPVTSGEETKTENASPLKATPLDYRRLGLLWDHPSMTNEEFHEALKNLFDKFHKECLDLIRPSSP